MSKISAGLKKTIEEIKRLADGSIDDQIGVCRRIHEKVFPQGKLKTGIDKSVIGELLPTIVKFMESNDHVLQKEGSDFVVSITNDPLDKANVKFVIDAGFITKLKNLLSSPKSDVLINALKALLNIAYHFPENVVENGILQPIIQCLKSENGKITFYSAWFMRHISYQSDDRTATLFGANGVEPLIKILESKNNDACEEVLNCFINITFLNEEFCRRLLDLGALKSLKKLCDRLFADKKPRRSNVKINKSKLKQEKVVKLLAIRLVEYVTLYGEIQVDLIIEENFIPLILQQIKSGMTPEIKIESIKVIEKVISVKRDFVSTLVEDYDFFSFCYSNLGSSNANLLIATLTVMSNIVKLSESRDIIRQKMEGHGSGSLTKLSNLCNHPNEQVRHLSTMIYEFVFDVKPVPNTGGSGESNQQESEVIEFGSENDATPEAPRLDRQQKRPANTQPTGRLRRSKRFKVSLEQADTETFDSSSSDNDGDEDGNDQNNDLDDHPKNSSPPGAAPIESNRHDHSGQRSFVDDDTVAADGSSRLYPKAEPAPPDYHMPAIPASRQSPDLPLASAPTNNETDQNEMKPSPSGRFGNQLRHSSNNSHVVPEAASTTNDGNIQRDHSGRQSFVGHDTVTADDGSSQFNPKIEAPPSPHHVDNPTTYASRQSPELPVAASTMNETDQDEMKPSPADRFGNPSRLSSNHSHVKLEAASTNNGNIRNNHVESQIVFKSETAATHDGNDQYNDLDDHPRSSSPLNLTTAAAPTESNGNDHSRRQTSVGENIVAADGHSRLDPKIEAPQTPQNYNMSATSASHQSPDLPVAASTINNEIAQNEIIPSLVGRFGNRSRPASNVFHASTTNDENILDNQAGRQIIVKSETPATADESVRNTMIPRKRSPADADFGNPLSRPTSASAPALPVASASTNDVTISNNIPSRKPSPVPQPVITFVPSNQVTPPGAPAPVPANNDINRDEIIKYFCPAEFLIHQYCDTLEIRFSRKQYSEFMSKIEFTQITSNSKPSNVYQPIDQTGFGCLSILLTGNENASSTIRMKINEKFIDVLSQSRNFDEEKITKVIAPPYLIKDQHFETIAAWLKCRIMVYCNGWKKYGSWDTDDQMIPIFVLKKKEFEGKTEYCIVLTLKNE